MSSLRALLTDPARNVTPELAELDERLNRRIGSLEKLMSELLVQQDARLDDRIRHFQSPSKQDSLEGELSERLHHQEAKLNDYIRESRTMFLNLTLPEQDKWRWTADGSAPSDNAFPTSTGCREEDFRQPWFAYWTDRMQERLRYHRKLWEFVYICQALYERGCLQPGKSGLGFGVGEEILPALFAASGCAVLATDQEADAAVHTGWTATAQHAAGKHALPRRGVCDEAIFEERVDFRAVDMNAIPDDIGAFDFCWSACALEHLGSIDKGLAFIENSVACLNPGGFAVHTTEFNISSNGHTLADGHTVLFRRRDFEAFAERMASMGHEVAPFDFSPGFGVMDNFIDAPPYMAEPHLKLALAGYACTSFGIVVRKKA